MRIGGGQRAFAQALLRSRCLISVLLVAVLGGLSPLAPDSWIGAVSQLVIPPAEARKAQASVTPTHGPTARARVSAFKSPAFMPLTHELAVRAPGNSLKAPEFAPPKHGRVLRPPASAHKAQAFASRRDRPTSRPTAMNDKSKGRHHFPKHRARDTAVRRPQDALMRHAAAEPKNDLHALPYSLGGHKTARRYAAFHRILGKLSMHSRRPRDKSAPVGAPHAKKSDGVASEASGVKKMVRRLGDRPVAELLPPIGSFRPNEVLAINLSAEGLAKVLGGNYELVGRIELPEFGLTVTRLRPPEGLNAISGRERLFDLLPGGGFVLNRVYAPYRLGSGPDRQRAGVGGAAHQHGRGCAPDRCFGTALINWQASLAACARDVKVGIVDTGFDKSHPAFAGLRSEYKEFLPEGSTGASSQHGTGILSLLAGNAGSGTPGLIPEAMYVVANAFFADSDGQPMSDTAQMLQALHWLKKSGVAIANLSFAGPEDELVRHGVQQLTKAGIVVVAAAGNDGPSAPPSYPAAYEEVIAVTAVDRNLAPYRYASRGGHIDVAAPGVEVWTALPGSREGTQTGTSFAVPYVTAVIAVGDLATGPRPDSDPLASKRRALVHLHKNIKSLGEHGRDATFGAGLVQAPARCGPLPLAVAAKAPATAEPWIRTVKRAADSALTGPLVVGAWVSMVRAAGNEVRH